MALVDQPEDLPQPLGSYFWRTATPADSFSILKESFYLVADGWLPARKF
jgi:hypothetical protein